MPHYKLSVHHDEELYQVLHFELAITVSSDNSSKIGCISGYMFEGDEEELIMLSDLDGDALDVMEVFLENQDHNTLQSFGTYHVVIIHKVLVHPAFRGMGVAGNAMKFLLDMLRRIGEKDVVLRVFPFEIRDREDYDPEDESTKQEIDSEIKRLVTFYERLGFEMLPDVDDGAYMHVDLRNWYELTAKEFGHRDLSSLVESKFLSLPENERELKSS